jgi:hypothetical protein
VYSQKLCSAFVETAHRSIVGKSVERETQTMAKYKTIVIASLTMILAAGCQPDPKTRSKFLVRNELPVAVRVNLSIKSGRGNFTTSPYGGVAAGRIGELAGVPLSKGACIRLTTGEAAETPRGQWILSVRVTEDATGKPVAVSIPPQMCDRIPFVIKPAS